MSPKPSEWQPIATAPKDGTHVLIWTPLLGVVAAAYEMHDIHWWYIDDGKFGPYAIRGPAPTCWMTMPDLPDESLRQEPVAVRSP